MKIALAGDLAGFALKAEVAKIIGSALALETARTWMRSWSVPGACSIRAAVPCLTSPAAGRRAGMSVNPVQVQKYLSGVDYPAGKDELVSKAEQEGADEKVMQTLRDLPGDRFDSPAEVSAAIGKEN
ncbi:DUF2795 domain-containing protein [Pseudonocardia sp. H11422]|uniref:DUF2795 domain-containing protein n=1 Tax=Pseudonocardia sp. H11422 TaxID=2835866 RepID=UPI0027E3553D|nr:DUF2795 domain-containing protein [Pseudonocardia sp. H11422]